MRLLFWSLCIANCLLVLTFQTDTEQGISLKPFFLNRKCQSTRYFSPILFISIFLKKLNSCLYFLQMPLVRYWFCVVFVAVGFVAWKSLRRQSSPNASGTITRKVFHLLALAIYIPGVIYEPNITHLASSVAVAAFLFIEVSEGGCWFVVPSLITFSLTYPRLRTCYVHVESKRTGLR